MLGGSVAGPFLSHLKSSFKSISEKNSPPRKKKNSSSGAFLWYLIDKSFIEKPSLQETSPALENSWLRACTIQILKFTHQDFLFSHLLKKSTCCVQKPVKHIKWNFSDVKAVFHSSYDILFYEILFC